MAGPDGTLYVADSNNKRIRKVLSDGTTSTYAVSAANLLSAFRLVYRSGDLYVIDRTNDALVRINNGNASIAYQLGALAAVGVNSGGTLFVTTTQDCYLRKMNAALTAGAKFSGTDACAFADGDAQMARFSISMLDLVFDGDTMLVVDAGNSRIRKVDAAGAVTTLAGATQGQADGAGSLAQFDAPTGITVDPQTHIAYVADKTRSPRHHRWGRRHDARRLDVGLR